MVYIPGVSKYEFRLCAVWEGVVESVELENRPAKKKTQSKQMEIISPCTWGCCLPDGLGIHAADIGSRLLSV